jgi:hypothetical protein
MGASAMLIQFTRIGSFTATDSARRLYEVVMTQECVQGDNPAIKPQQFLQTDDGQRVERKRKGHYIVVPTGELLWSNDPCCP